MNLASTSPTESSIASSNLRSVQGSPSQPSDVDCSDSSSSAGGLGFFDSTKPILEIELDLLPASTTLTDPVGKRGGNGAKRSSKAEIDERGKVQSINVTLQQDLGALKSRKGDTGGFPQVNLLLRRHI